MGALTRERHADSKDAYQVMTRGNLMERNGWVKMWRFGSLNFRKQGYLKERAPLNKGLWAFPYPVFDSFYTHHKYDHYLPKRIVEGQDYEEYVKWIETNEKKVLKLHEFWYKGDVYTHLYPNGSVGNSEGFEDVTWSRMESGLFLQTARKLGIRQSIRSASATGGFTYYPEEALYFEVFIGHGMGQFRSSPGK